VLNLDVSQEDAPFRRHEARIVVVIAPPIRVDLNGSKLLISHLEEETALERDLLFVLNRYFFLVELEETLLLLVVSYPFEVGIVGQDQLVITRDNPVLCPVLAEVEVLNKCPEAGMEFIDRFLEGIFVDL
jgi:hypothetical protein